MQWYWSVPLLKDITVNYMLTGADQRSATEKRVEDQSETSLALTTQDRLHNQKESDVEKAVADDCSSGNQGDETGPDDSGSDGADLPKGRPMSPETLALMCDEQDTMFMAAASPSGTGHGCNISSQQGTTEVYEEQERIVLSKFRDCLKMLIALGEIKGKFISFKSSVYCIFRSKSSLRSIVKKFHIPLLSRASFISSIFNHLILSNCTMSNPTPRPTP